MLPYLMSENPYITSDATPLITLFMAQIATPKVLAPEQKRDATPQVTLPSRRGFLASLAAATLPSVEALARAQEQELGPAPIGKAVAIADWKASALFDHQGQPARFNPRQSRLTRGDALSLIIQATEKLREEIKKEGLGELKQNQVVELTTLYRGEVYRRVSLSVNNIPAEVSKECIAGYLKLEEGRQVLAALTHGIMAIEAAQHQDGSYRIRFAKKTEPRNVGPLVSQARLTVVK